MRQVIRRLVALLAFDVCPPGVEGNLNRILQLLKLYAQLTAYEIKEGPEEKPRGAFRQEPGLGTQALEERIQELVEEAREGTAYTASEVRQLDPEQVEHATYDPEPA